MVRDLAVARIKQGLGFRSGPDMDASIILALQEAQRVLERGTSLPYFLKVEDQSLSVTSGTGEIALPSRFLREVDDEGPHYTDTANNKLVNVEKVDFAVAKKRFFAESPGKPIAWCLRRATMAFFPERDTTYTLTWSYYQGGLPLTTNIENAWLEEEFGSPEALIGSAGFSIASDLRNASAQAIFTQMINVGWKGALADGYLRDEANLPIHLGGKL